MAKKYYDHTPKADYEGKYDKKARPGAPGPVYSMEHAGMPRESVMESYPSQNYSLDGYADNVQGIDFFAKQNNKKIMMQKREMGDS